MWQEQGGKCLACHEVYEPRDMELDHMVPLSDGGGEDRRNLQMLCKTCHQDKTARENSRRR